MSASVDRLRRGERILIGGTVYRVVMVNECRARCVALIREPVELRDRRTGSTRRFTATRQQAIDISPCAIVERVTGRRRVEVAA